MDTRTPAQRRQIMAAVRSRDTAPELALRRGLYASGARGWRCNYARAAGKPDIVWVAPRLAVFVDGAFWHGHPSRHRPGRSGEYWDLKIAANVARDRRVDAQLEGAGWLVLRVWDFEVGRALDDVIARIASALRSRVSESWQEPSWCRRLRSDTDAELLVAG